MVYKIEFQNKVKVIKNTNIFREFKIMAAKCLQTDISGMQIYYKEDAQSQVLIEHNEDYETVLELIQASSSSQTPTFIIKEVKESEPKFISQATDLSMKQPIVIVQNDQPAFLSQDTQHNISKIDAQSELVFQAKIINTIPEEVDVSQARDQHTEETFARGDSGDKAFVGGLIGATTTDMNKQPNRQKTQDDDAHIPDFLQLQKDIQKRNREEVTSFKTVSMPPNNQFISDDGNFDDGKSVYVRKSTHLPDSVQEDVSSTGTQIKKLETLNLDKIEFADVDDQSQGICTESKIGFDFQSQKTEIQRIPTSKDSYQSQQTAFEAKQNKDFEFKSQETEFFRVPTAKESEKQKNAISTPIQQNEQTQKKTSTVLMPIKEEQKQSVFPDPKSITVHLLDNSQSLADSFVTDSDMRDMTIHSHLPVMKQKNSPKVNTKIDEPKEPSKLQETIILEQSQSIDELTLKNQGLIEILKNLRPTLVKQKTIIDEKDQIINALKKEKEQMRYEHEQSMRQSQAQVQQARDGPCFPCFRCDGRATEKGRSDPCRRCKGTGKVNTLHEKAIMEMITSMTEKHVSHAMIKMSQSNVDIKQSLILEQNKVEVTHPGVSCLYCKNNPLKGSRYMCLVCPEVDICESCEAKQNHSEIHSMALIKTPKLNNPELLQLRQSAQEQSVQDRAMDLLNSLMKDEGKDQDKKKAKSEYKVQFLQQTIQRNSIFKTQDLVTNYWTFKNTGPQIPIGVKLTKVEGSPDFGPQSIEVKQVVEPSQLLFLEFKSEAPDQKGLYAVYYQLYDDKGLPFGEKVSTIIEVVDDQDESIAVMNLMDTGKLQNLDQSIKDCSAFDDLDKPSVQPQPPNNDPISTSTTGSFGQSDQQINQSNPKTVRQSSWGMQNFDSTALTNTSVHSAWAVPVQPLITAQPQENIPIAAGNNPYPWGIPQPANQANPKPNPYPWGQPLPPPQPVPPVNQAEEVSLAERGEFDFNPQHRSIRYPTVSLTGAQAVAQFGHPQVANGNNQVEEEKKQDPQSYNANYEYKEFGNQPPALPNFNVQNNAGNSAAGAALQNREKAYVDKLQEIFPAQKNYNDPKNKDCREAMLTMRDYGYDNFELNLPVIQEMANKNQIADLQIIQVMLEQKYNPQQQPQNNNNIPQPRPAPVPVYVAQPIQNEPFVFGRDANKQPVIDLDEVKYMEQVDKKLPMNNNKYKQKNELMKTLYQFGYREYNKNDKAIDQNKGDLNLILNNMNKYYKD